MSAEDTAKCAAACELHPQAVTDALTRLSGDDNLRAVLRWKIEQAVAERDRVLRTVEEKDLKRRQGEIVGLNLAAGILKEN